MAAAILAIIVDLNDLIDHLFLSSFRGLQDLNLSLNLNIILSFILIISQVNKFEN